MPKVDCFARDGLLAARCNDRDFNTSSAAQVKCYISFVGKRKWPRRLSFVRNCRGHVIRPGPLAVLRFLSGFRAKAGELRYDDSKEARRSCGRSQFSFEPIAF